MAAQQPLLPDSQPQHSEKVDPVLYLLFVGMLFFTFILMGVEHFFMQDGQMFQVIAGLLAGFSGAFFGRLKPNPQTPAGGNANSFNVNTAPPPPAPVPTPLDNPAPVEPPKA